MVLNRFTLKELAERKVSDDHQKALEIQRQIEEQTKELINILNGDTLFKYKIKELDEFFKYIENSNDIDFYDLCRTLMNKGLVYPKSGRLGEDRYEHMRITRSVTSRKKASDEETLCFNIVNDKIVLVKRYDRYTEIKDTPESMDKKISLAYWLISNIDKTFDAIKDHLHLEKDK